MRDESLPNPFPPSVVAVICLVGLVVAFRALDLSSLFTAPDGVLAYSLSFLLLLSVALNSSVVVFGVLFIWAIAKRQRHAITLGLWFCLAVLAAAGYDFAWTTHLVNQGTLSAGAPQSQIAYSRLIRGVGLFVFGGLYLQRSQLLRQLLNTADVENAA